MKISPLRRDQLFFYVLSVLVLVMIFTVTSAVFTYCLQTAIIHLTVFAVAAISFIITLEIYIRIMKHSERRDSEKSSVF